MSHLNFDRNSHVRQTRSRGTRGRGVCGGRVGRGGRGTRDGRGSYIGRGGTNSRTCLTIGAALQFDLKGFEKDINRKSETN